MAETKDDRESIDLERTRQHNLRQLLSRATRKLNERVVSALRTHGYDDVRLAHGALLINLGLEGSTVTEVADRAQVPKQAMSKLAAELEEMGFISRDPHPSDGRAWNLRFTRRGRELVKHTIGIVSDIEREAAATIGPRRYAQMCKALDSLSEAWELKREGGGMSH